MELGTNKARIKDYGLSKTKNGNTQIWVELLVAGQEIAKWYGYPVKKDGEINEMCIGQLAYAGFDVSGHAIEELAFGRDQGLLVLDDDIEIVVKEETQPNGSLMRKVAFLGTGMSSITQEEAASLITDAQRAKIKALAEKYPKKKRVKKESPLDELPF